MRVVITGAAGNPASKNPMSIGAATAVELASGATAMCLIDQNVKGLNWTRERLPEELDVTLVECDVRNAKQLESAVVGPVAQGIDLVASVAGGTKVQSLFDHDADSLTDEILINLLSHVWLARYVLPGMCERGKGSFVVVGSDSAIVGAAGLCGYTAAKGGLMSFVKSVSREVGPSGVRVNCVSPGPTRTPSRDRLTAEDVPGGFRDDPPLGRMGEPEDVAAAIAFLASQQASFITGQTLSVNGGRVTV
jgi:2-hydroxycyclohexanecarboxyl-CoA dehydrogenase